MISTIVFIACHGGPADHFATFAEGLGRSVEFYASGAGLKKLQDRNVENITAFEGDGILSIDLTGKTVITDLGHALSEPLLKSLTEKNIQPIAYYDNGEPYVPGGYSSTVAKAVKYASKVLFANAHLAKEPIYEAPGEEIDLPFDKRIGLGYYPLQQAEKIAKERKAEHSLKRAEFLKENNIEDRGQKVLAYFGGNNTEYFKKAFPAFLSFLPEDQADLVLVLQQHPGAKNENLDTKQISTQNIIISNKTSDDMQIIADGALYYQTSMGPLFAFAGIPTVQVGHEVYNDILVRGNLCRVATSPETFFDAIQDMKEEPVSIEQKNEISKSLGIKSDWFEAFKGSLIRE